MPRPQEQEIGSVDCKSFFPIFLQLVASLFMDLETALLLTDYGTPWVLLLMFLLQGSHG
jgi:hypothetical protein